MITAMGSLALLDLFDLKGERPCIVPECSNLC